MNLLTRLLLPATLLALAPGAWAATCTISPSDLAFGPYSAYAAADLDTSADITIQCLPDLNGVGASYTIELSAGSSGSYSPRSMSGDAASLQYNIYTDPSRTLVWGDGTGGTLVVANSIDGIITTSATHTAYGRTPAGQTRVVPGTYTDLLTVSVTY